MTDRAFDPLDRQTYEALTYNAVGRASEIEGYPAYALSHSTGRSGWSVGAVQWDFGQPGRGEGCPSCYPGERTFGVQRHSPCDLAKFSRIDHVELSVRRAQAAPGERIFAVQGRLDDAANRVAHMKAQDAVATSVHESATQLRTLQHSQQHPHGQQHVNARSPVLRTS